MRVLGYQDLSGKGIPWTRQHVSKLVRLGRFPRPFKLGDNTNAWTEDEIDEYLKDRVAGRDTALKAISTTRNRNRVSPGDKPPAPGDRSGGITEPPALSFGERRRDLGSERKVEYAENSSTFSEVNNETTTRSGRCRHL